MKASRCGVRTDIEGPAARGPWVGLALREEYEAPVTGARAEQRAAGADRDVESHVQCRLVAGLRGGSPADRCSRLQYRGARLKGRIPRVRNLDSSPPE